MFLFSLIKCTSIVCSSGKLKFPRTYIEGTETKFLQSDLALHAEIDVDLHDFEHFVGTLMS